MCHFCCYDFFCLPPVFLITLFSLISHTKLLCIDPHWSEAFSVIANGQEVMSFSLSTTCHLYH